MGPRDRGQRREALAVTLRDQGTPELPALMPPSLPPSPAAAQLLSQRQVSFATQDQLASGDRRVSRV